VAYPSLPFAFSSIHPYPQTDSYIFHSLIFLFSVMEPPNKREEDSNYSTLNEEEGIRQQNPDLEKQPTDGTSEAATPTTPMFPETDLSRGLIGWDGQDDPKNPQNFATAKKWSLLAVISAMTLISPLASSMFAPAISYMAAEFKETNETILSFSVSIYLLGYTVSPGRIFRAINDMKNGD
jgi:hypothetical protein